MIVHDDIAELGDLRLTSRAFCTNGGRWICMDVENGDAIAPIIAIPDAKNGALYILDGNQRAFCCTKHRLSLGCIQVTGDSDADVILGLESSGAIPSFPFRDFLMGRATYRDLLDHAKAEAQLHSCITVNEAVSQADETAGTDIRSTAGNVVDHRDSGSSIIAALEGKWTQKLDADDCPPILGLAPLSVEEVDAVSELVSGLFPNRSAGYRFQVLLGLMERYPAILSLWLARKAGEAYEYGAFWPQFADAIGFDIPPNERPALTLAFEIACRRSMSTHVAAPASASRHYVSAFLFQAGLPLSHCKNFARHMRKCERRTGLPDPEDPDAAEYLRDLLVESLRPEALTVLKRALSSSAGPYICDVALHVVLAGSFDGINPSLGEELSRAFQNQSARSLRRAARQPFLRLAYDLCSLEIVGPPQDKQLIEPSGMNWVFNGQAYRHPSTEHFLFPIQDESRVVVELRGLRNSQTLLRTFVLDVNEGEKPFMLFDVETRKFCSSQAVDGGTLYLSPGQYWILHADSCEVSPAAESYPWADGRVLSLLNVQPGKPVALMGSENGPSYQFAASATPFFECDGLSLLTDDGVRVRYSMDSLPCVWFPRDEVDGLGAMSLSVSAGGWEEEVMLDPESVGDSDWVRCRVSGGRALDELSPGLHRVELVLRKNQRTQCRKSFLYWSQLAHFHDGCEFTFTAPPENLIEAQCSNFLISRSSIRHVGEHIRQATLAFEVEGRVESLHWSREGTFLESFEKQPGREIQPEPCAIGTAFSASSRSRRWLRIWPRRAQDVDVQVNGQLYTQLFASSRQRHIDVSLATLALSHPQGGSITLHGRGYSALEIARFSPPLIPERVESCDDGAGLIFHFPDRISHLRPRVSELVAGVRAGAYEQTGELADEGMTFCCEDSPTVFVEEFSASSLADLDVVSPGHGIRLTATPGESLPGIWRVELEARRNEDSDWQLLTTPKGKRLPALLVVRPTRYDEDHFRSSLIWSALDAHGSHVLGLSPEIFAENEHELPGLLSEIFALIDRGFGKAVRPQFFWLENLCHDLSQEVSRTLARQDSDDVRKLLFLASGDRAHSSYRSLFVNVPGLLALPSPQYSDVSTGQALSRSLQWCGRLSDYELLIEAVQDCTSGMLDVFEVPPFFDNFNGVMRQAETGDLSDDFSRFDYDRYWGSGIGVIEDDDAYLEWDWASPLGRTHARWSVACLKHRRERREVDNDTIMGQVTGVLSLSKPFLKFVRRQLAGYRAVMPGSAWERPWLRVQFEEDHFLNSCAQFASVFALAARASGMGWLMLDDAMAWLRDQNIARGSAERALAALVGMAPEMFGYYLMFWELMIRTYPHA